MHTYPAGDRRSGRRTSFYEFPGISRIRDARPRDVDALRCAAAPAASEIVRVCPAPGRAPEYQRALTEGPRILRQPSYPRWCGFYVRALIFGDEEASAISADLFARADVCLRVGARVRGVSNEG